jgi:hypothetical protein
MNRPGTAEVRWPRIYRVFRAVGHDPAPATEIVLDAKRKDDHARAWIKAVLAMSAAISILESCWREGDGCSSIARAPGSRSSLIGRRARAPPASPLRTQAGPGVCREDGPSARRRRVGADPIISIVDFSESVLGRLFALAYRDYRRKARRNASVSATVPSTPKREAEVFSARHHFAACSWRDLRNDRTRKAARTRRWKP